MQDQNPVLPDEVRPSEAAAASAPGAYETTASGFRTRNANDAVSAETIESWYQSREYLPRLEDIIGMEEIKTRLSREFLVDTYESLSRALGINPVQVYFFYGLPGTGKTMLIHAVANALMEKGFKFLAPRTMNLCSNYGYGAEKALFALFNEAVDAADESAGCILFIDEIECICLNQPGDRIRAADFRMTRAFLSALSALTKCGKRVVFFSASCHPMEVDPAFLEKARLLGTLLPDADAREALFRNAFHMLTPAHAGLYRQMAEETENFCFRELNLLASNTRANLQMQLIRDETNWVLDEKGNRDDRKTDEHIAELVGSGSVYLDMEPFYRARTELKLPGDKSVLLKELRDFEDLPRGV